MLRIIVGITVAAIIAHIACSAMPVNARVKIRTACSAVADAIVYALRILTATIDLAIFLPAFTVLFIAVRVFKLSKRLKNMMTPLEVIKDTYREVGVHM